LHFSVSQRASGVQAISVGTLRHDVIDDPVSFRLAADPIGALVAVGRTRRSAQSG
jgi:hypothetical protein